MNNFFGKYKKRLISTAVFVCFFIINILTLCGCSKNPKTNPELKVGESVRIDFASEQFKIYESVCAVDGNGEDITDRVKAECSQNIEVVDGKVVFPSTGDYTFKYSVEDAYGNYSEFEKTVYVRNIVSVYLTNATIPPLYSALDMAGNGYKFIFFNDRTGTVDTSVYGDRVIGSYKESQEQYNNALNDFYDIYDGDEHSYFRIFLPDARNQNLIKYFVTKGIAEDRYEVKYLSDGSMSYNTSFPYRGDNAYELWQKNTEIYSNMYELARQNKPLIYDGITIDGDYLGYELHNAYICAAQKDNAEFWGAFPETLTSSDKRVQAEIEKAHLIKKQPEKMYGELSQAQKDNFLNSVSFDKNDFDTKYFSKEGKYLIITGTNPVTGKFSVEQFISLLEEITSDYSDYNLLFKPHPSSIPSETVFPELYAYMVERGITVLPGRLPMEVISWIYDDALVGGFDSSLYMAVPQGNVAFFIAQNKNALSAVSLMLYESGAFGDVDFYWIRSEV